ncbi:sensor histidine kinase [Flavobacterium okayamense]|uniref:Histidine kinase n=1 Tax=Flavobacterium okayamense TaxID=2830782 RepID=A0ABM7S6H1_9FLAO|nr:histidine kinase [Flavobacterium okayamense]BCY28964.1 histidine kinase [Flavobacterium okayamense]
MKYCFTITFLIVSTILFSQTPVIYEFGNELSKYSNEFYDIIETPNKTKWLSSENGLLTYDGRNFKKVRNEKQKGNTVFNLQIDEEGKLWFNNLYGQFFYLKNDSIYLYEDFNSILKGRLSQFTVKNKSVYLFSSKGIYCSTENKTIKISDKPALTYCYANGNGYFLDNDNNIFRFDFSTNEITLVSNLQINKSSSKPILFSVNSVCFLFTEYNGNGNFYKITETDVIQVNSPKNKLFERLINVNVIGNKVFVLSYNGTHLFTYENESFGYKNTFFKDNKVSSVYKDSEDNYWFTTLKDGIKVVPNLNLFSNNYNYKKYGYIVGSKVKSNNEVIFYTDLGYLLLFNSDKGITNFLKVPTKNIISAIEIDQEKALIYIGVNNNESFIYDLRNKTFTKTSLFNVAKDIKIIDDKVLYLTYNKSVLYSFNASQVLENIVDDSRAYTSLYSNSRREFFIATANGVFKFSNEVKSLLNCDNEVFHATSIVQTSNQTVWFSSVSNRLFYLKDNKVSNYQFKNFAPKEIKFIKAFKNEVWLATEKGLIKIDIENNFKETLFNTRNSGIESTIQTLEILNDKIFYTSNKEIFSIKKDLLNTKQTEIPNAYFTSVTVLDKEIDFNKEIELTHEKNNVKFSFNSNAFNNSENISYKYRLKNYDNSWRQIEDAERSVKYLSIPPGNYVFEVFPYYVDEVLKNDNKKIELAIVVKQPFWETIWFMLLIGFIIVIILFTIITVVNRFKLNKKNREISELLIDKRMTSLQLENLRSQMNPHFIFNALNSIQDYIVTNEKKLASSYLIKFSRLMRLYLEQSQVNEISLKEEIETLELYLSLEKNRFEADFEYEIKYDDNLLISQIKIPSLLLQPFIENAIKHGLSNKKGNKKIVVCFYQKANFIEIIIDDNGVGREATQNKENEYKSFATKATTKRVELINKNYKKNISVDIKDKYDELKNPSGTTVIIKISK